MNELNQSSFYNPKSLKIINHEKCSLVQKKKNLKRDLESILNIRVVLALSHLHNDYLCKKNYKEIFKQN